MSNTATRAIAIQEAVKLGLDQGVNTVAGIIAIAQELDAYLEPTAGAKTDAAPAATNVKPATTTAGKPATGKTETKKAEATKPAGPTKDDVVAAIDAALKANNKTKLLAILKKYNAKSASSVAEKDYAKFLKEAAPLAEEATEAAEEDLTA